MKHPMLQKAEHLLDDARMIKDSGEVDRLRKVAKLTDETVEAIGSTGPENAARGSYID